MTEAKATSPTKSLAFMEGGGEMGALTRAYNWEANLLGPPAAWPLNLQLTLSMLLSSRFPMFLWWGEELIQFYNDAYRPSLGLTGKHPDALGQKGVDCWPEIWDFIYPLIRKVKDTGEATWHESQFLPIFRNGKLEDVYWTFSYSAIKNENGHVDGVLVVCHETTKTEQALSDLKKSEEQVRSMVQSAPFPIAVYTGKEMRISLANEAIFRIWGKGPEVIGMLYKEAVPEIADQDLLRIMDEVYTSGVAFHAKNHRIRLQRDDRTRDYYFNYSITPLFDASGGVYGVMSTAADVTDLNEVKEKLERSERNLRNTILQAPVAMCLLKGEHLVVEIANEKMYELWGTPAERLHRKPIFEGLPEVRNQGFEEMLQSVLTRGESISAQEVVVTLPRNGKVEGVYVNFLYTPYRENADTIDGVLVVAVDVTSQVNAKNRIEEIVGQRTRELAEANENLQKSNSELEQFAYIASHDLQEPLRKISIFAQMLNNALPQLEERGRSYLVKITNASMRMTTLIRDLLAYSQVSKEQTSFEEVDLNRIIEGTISDFEVVIEQREALIQYERLPVIDAIPLQMTQLFANLVSNSIKYSGNDRQPVITITTRELTDEEAAPLNLSPDRIYHRIDFADNGIGFRPEYAEQIFNIFQRLHRKTEYAGTGIGLAICRKIAENHHGHIEAMGEPGKGAVFTVVLPARQE